MDVSKTSGSYCQTQRYLGTAEMFPSLSWEMPRSDSALGMKGISGLWEEVKKKKSNKDWGEITA